VRSRADLHVTAASPVSPHVTFSRHPLLARLALVCWALITFAISASLAAAHWVALPKPERHDPQLARAVAGLRDPAGAGWLSVHALYSHCRCSERILTHLLKRAAVSGVQEHVLWIGPSPERESELQTAGFAVHTITPQQLKRDFAAVAVPLLIVADARDRLRYSGGYTTRSQGADIRDQAILQNLMWTGAQTELPVFGCAVSRSLQKLLDPFALKY
jgi:hypothetical protein